MASLPLPNGAEGLKQWDSLASKLAAIPLLYPLPLRGKPGHDENRFA